MRINKKKNFNKKVILNNTIVKKICCEWLSPWIIKLLGKKFLRKFSSCKIVITGITSPIDNNSNKKELIIKRPKTINFEKPNF